MLTKKALFKLIAFNGALVLVNIVLFSNAFFGIMGSGNIFLTAFGVTVIIMSVILFIYVNLIILLKSDKTDVKIAIKNEDIRTLDICVQAINQTADAATFSESMKTVIEQINRLKKKKNTIKDILLQKFADTELSYERFRSTVENIEMVMCLNVRSMLNRINAFDEEEYSQIKKGRSGLSDSVIQSKLDIYNEYISFVDNAVDDNEEILLKLDRLLLEISKFNSLSDGEVEDMDAMKEIDALIKDTKWYK